MPSPRQLHRIGYALLVLSFLLFLASIYVPFGRMGFVGGYFPFMFLISAIYFVLILLQHWMQHRWKRLFQGDEIAYSIALVLFSLSAHSLNFGGEFQVFAPYSSWFYAYVIVGHLAILLMPWRNRLPEWIRYPVFFLAGASMIMALYATLYLAPIILFAIPMGIFLGLTLHITVPMWCLIELIAGYVRIHQDRVARSFYLAGVVVPLVLLSVYMSRWDHIQTQIQAEMQQFETLDADYPLWVHLSQHLPDDPFTEMVLLSDATSEHLYRGNLINDITGSNLEHNPLAVIAQILYGPLGLAENVLTQVLESRYDIRHMTHRRLWRDTDLTTKRVDTEVHVFPAYRLAYLEQTLHIHHGGSWGQQEGVYTFYLPEGAVVSALSLWINGKEEKARLSTRAKADSAYATIVGVEKRDPALLHWQEGNRVTVTIFPCTPEEDRIFKLGITLPLQADQEGLHLDRVYFDGPDAHFAREKMAIQFIGPQPSTVRLSGRFEEEEAGRFVYEGRYIPFWTMHTSGVPLGEGVFQFQGRAYRVQELRPEHQAFTPKTIYLDVHARWRADELEAVWQALRNKPVYVFDPDPVLLTDNNFQSISQRLRQRRFSLVPAYRIDKPEQALVISKGSRIAPHLDDLQGSLYVDRMQDWLSQGHTLKWINIGSDLSPYVATLQDFGRLDVWEMQASDLAPALEQGSFPVLAADTLRQAFPGAGMMIVQMPAGMMRSTAPDHLARLFAFRRLCQEIGPHYWKRSAMEHSWLRQAEAAFVVSPISSLVVLESQTDYERFGIEENTDTLGNASLENSGAVPEPGEWALIILVAGLVLAGTLKSYLG